MQPTDTSAVVEALRANDRFVVTSHDNPDGDALGSLLATHLALDALGKDSVMVLGGLAPLPGEYAFLELEARGSASGRRRPMSASGCSSPSTARRRAGSSSRRSSRRRR